MSYFQSNEAGRLIRHCRQTTDLRAREADFLLTIVQESRYGVCDCSWSQLADPRGKARPEGKPVKGERHGHSSRSTLAVAYAEVGQGVVIVGPQITNPKNPHCGRQKYLSIIQRDQKHWHGNNVYDCNVEISTKARLVEALSRLLGQPPAAVERLLPEGAIEPGYIAVGGGRKGAQSRQSGILEGVLSARIRSPEPAESESRKWTPLSVSARNGSPVSGHSRKEDSSLRGTSLLPPVEENTTALPAGSDFRRADEGPDEAPAPSRVCAGEAPAVSDPHAGKPGAAIAREARKPPTGGGPRP
jgi:hypothetical protein